MAKKPAIVNTDAAAEASELENAFPKKWADKLPTGFTDTAAAMSDEELKKVIVDCEGNIYTIDKEKQGDAKLKAAKEIAKEISAPYRDASNAQMAKIKYSLYLLENRGVDLDSTDTEG